MPDADEAERSRRPAGSSCSRWPSLARAAGSRSSAVRSTEQDRDVIAQPKVLVPASVRARVSQASRIGRAIVKRLQQVQAPPSSTSVSLSGSAPEAPSRRSATPRMLAAGSSVNPSSVACSSASSEPTHVAASAACRGAVLLLIPARSISFTGRRRPRSASTNPLAHEGFTRSPIDLRISRPSSICFCVVIRANHHRFCAFDPSCP